MDYSQTLNYLYARLPMFQREGAAAYKADLETTAALDLYDGSPHLQYITIHVAGTNGKGSVAHMLASILMAAGYKTGLFTSPHIADYRERIRVNGERITQEYVRDYIESHLDVFEEYSPSFFEVTTALALSYFAHEGVEIAVIETGMGGRLDSTNIISPALCVITNIGLDHTQFLGSTLDVIAQEKAGIIKPNTPVVFGVTLPETKRILISTANQKHSRFVIATEEWTCRNWEIKDTVQHFDFENKRTHQIIPLETDLMGRAQLRNIATVLAAIDVLNWEISNITTEHIQQGIRNVQAKTHIMGRWQLLQTSPRVIADVGHNYDGLKKEVKQLGFTQYKRLRWVFGVSHDKDVPALLSLLPKEGRYYLTQASVPRALAVEKLNALAEAEGLETEVFHSVPEALRKAIADADPEDLIMIGGSFFVVADVFTMDEYIHLLG